MRMKPRTRKSFYTLIVPASQCQFVGKDLLFEVPAGKSGAPSAKAFAPVSENRIFRNPEFTKTINLAVGEETVERNGTRCIVFANDNLRDKNASSLRIDVALKRGIYVKFPDDTILHYKRVMRSPSQYRTAKMLMAEVDYVDKIREYAGYGWITRMLNQNQLVAKVEPYLANAGTTSTWSAGYGYTAEYIPDFEVELDMSKALVTRADGTISTFEKETGRKTEIVEATDGQSAMKPKAMAKVSYEIGMLSKKEYQMILGAYHQGMSFYEQQEDPILKPIWKHVLRGFQFRWGLTKGFMYMEPALETMGVKVDMWIASGSNKAEVDTLGLVKQEDIELCVANISKLEEGIWGNLNYQFINALNITFPQLRAIANKALNEIKKALYSPEDALAFLGMAVGNEEDDIFDEDTHVDNLRQIIASNPTLAMKSPWVQKKLKALMEKKIMDMRRGRIPVKDSRFVYIITDPNVFTGEPLLQPGEYYYNGRVGKASIFRSPLVHKSEPVGINLVANDELNKRFGHLKNILIFNAFDDTAPRMGGADFDGDKVLLLFDYPDLKVGEEIQNDVIYNSIEHDAPLVYGDLTVHDIKVTPYTPEAVIEYDRKTFKGTDIGITTTYGTTWADKARQPGVSDEVKENYWNKVLIARITQGKMIDDAKNGTNTDAPKPIEIEEQPHWLKDVRQMDVPRYKRCYHSRAPLGQLYDYIVDVVKPRFDNWVNEVKGQTQFESMLQVETERLNLATIEQLKVLLRRLESNYRADLYDLRNRYQRLEDDLISKEEKEQLEEQRKHELGTIIEFHREVLQSYNLPPVETACAALFVAENDFDRSAHKASSYPYVIATEYLVYILQGLEGNFRLVRAEHVEEDKFEGEVAVKNNYIMKDDEVIGVANVTDGTYATHTHKKNFYLKVPFTPNVVDLPTVKHDNKKVQVVFKAFKRFTDKHGNPFTCDSVAPHLLNREVTITPVDEKNNLTASVNGRNFAYIGAESHFEKDLIKNKKIKVKKVRISRGLLIVDGIITGEHENTEKEPVVESSSPSESTEEETIQPSFFPLLDSESNRSSDDDDIPVIIA